ncbi:hypothetical protein LWI29_021166 [Acer saccharum]|uniref:PGG domain-containing protein n=1 Tax=Acer saccharum TaxID=4024 RepID=A0AA39W9A0_ACESA|nr:hypothetical protein LWI29_021166 [Acer saccharum]
MSANDGAASSSNVAAEDTYMDPQLYDAAVKGNIEPFENITARELDSIVTPNKNTILHINIMSRKRSSMETASTMFVEEILNMCPSLLYQVDVNGETPLHVAAKYGHSDVVEVLIKSTTKFQHEGLESGIGAAKQILRMTNNEGNTALHEAVKYKHLDVVKILTKVDPYFTYFANKRGETPLHIAAAKDSLEILVEILKTCRLLAHEDPYQMTALYASAKNQDPDITRKIPEEKKSLINKTDYYGWTPLHYAAYHRNSETMKLLLEDDIFAAYIGDKHRRMAPLHIAIGRGYIPNEIISRCPDCCELVDKRRWNVLHFAMLSLTYEDLEILLRDPLIRNLINNKDVDGNTPLHLLATFRSPLLRKIKDMVGDIPFDFGFDMSVGRVVDSGSHQLTDDVVIDGDQRKEEVKKAMEKAKESHLIVAALIATVTFTAAFTLPGGMIQEGDKEGTAILSKKAAFQAFVITDALAMVLSLSAVFAHFLMSTPVGEANRFLVLHGAYFTMIAMGAMVIAFVTGTYAMLTTSLWLAILTTSIGLSFFY